MKYFIVIGDNIKQHHKLNRKLIPCEESSHYSFINCVERNLSRKFECVIPWIMKSMDNFTVCSDMKELRWISMMYTEIMFHDSDLKNVIKKTGCVKPCHYKEYELDQEENWPGKRDSEFVILFSNSDVVIEKELASYSAVSLISDIGGALGLFLGFSFLMLWDSAMAVAKGIINCFLHKYCVNIYGGSQRQN